MSKSKTKWLASKPKCPVRPEFGYMSGESYLNDPKHIGFVMARYKFVAKMLAGKTVLEVGCGDAFYTPIVAQTAKQVTCVDIDEKQIVDNRRRLKPFKNISFITHDLCATRLHSVPQHDAAFAIDVVEHIYQDECSRFLLNLAGSLTNDGVAIIGTPNFTAVEYSSPNSKAAHVNLKSGGALKFECEQYFNNVFIFGMNDEVLHTGFIPMAHYLFALCVGRKALE